MTEYIPVVIEGEACADCDEPATVKRLCRFAWYGFCPAHDPEALAEKNSFGFATFVYGSGMVVTHTFPRVVEAIAEQRFFMRGRIVGAASNVLRFSDGRWREMSEAEKTIAIHDEGETHMRDECGRCMAEVNRVLQENSWMKAVLDSQEGVTA